MGPSAMGKVEMFFFPSRRCKTSISILTVVLLMNRAIAELPDLLLCGMTH